MPYCDQAALENHLSPKSLVQLTDDENTKVLNLTRMNGAILAADSTIDGFLGGLNLTVPLNPVPNLIQKISIDLTIWELYSRRPGNKIPTSVSDRQVNAMKLLEKIQNGKISLGSGTTAVSTGPGAYKTNMKETDRIFNKTLLDKF